LAGDDALTARQQHGARLFFTRAEQGGAGCFSCHSGPMLNKQPNDPDIRGRGALVEENFFNIGIGDHPLQALNALRRGRLQLDGDGHPLPHGEDTGRQEITDNPEHAYKFRSLTLRQLKDARTFFHNGSFTQLRDVVSYFNNGIAQDQHFAGKASTLDPRFTHPRGADAERGLGLRDEDVDAISDFLENGLYDPNFARDFQPNDDDLHYSKHRQDLAALGARDGTLLSGRAIDNDDPLSRRDQGLEFLDVTERVHTTRMESSCVDDTTTDVHQIENTNDSVIDTHLLVIVRGLPARIELEHAEGRTRTGDPYVRVFLDNGVLEPGHKLTQRLVLRDPERKPLPAYSLQLLSGQGKP
ncbi:MAG TPA: hypothetical protein VMF89_08365, partial [Polyangiales bacterium]|nr:hypothetical protein [Polyangiales bacterium]